MNRDFVLPATPAVARRLLLLKRLCPIDLPDDLAELAQRDRIGEAAFDAMICPYTPERAAVTQFLLDNNLRGIVQARGHPCINELSMLNIARLAAAAKITVLTRRAGCWRAAANAWFLDHVDIRPPLNLTGRWIDERRGGPLIIDLHDDNYRLFCRPLMREFPQVMFYQSLQVSPTPRLHWRELAALLFPTMPSPIEPQTRSPHATSTRLNNIALFYNVCSFGS